MATNFDEFDQAVLIAFNRVQATDDVKLQATSYCERIKLSTDGWKFALSKLPEITMSDKDDVIKFLLIDIVNYGISNFYTNMSEDDRSNIRTSLFVYIRDIVPKAPKPLTDYLKGKLSTVFVSIIKHDYPLQWPTFFTDFLSLLPSAFTAGDGSESVDLFLRVLRSLEEDLIQADAAYAISAMRSKSESVNVMRVKDAMREHALNEIIPVIHSIIVQFSATPSKVNLASQALKILAVYIEWIDVELVVNDKFFPLLYSLMDNVGCRSDVISLLIGICSKGMSIEKRLALYKHINVVNVLSSYTFSTDTHDQYIDENDDFSCHVAKLLDVISLQLTSSYNELCHEYIASHAQFGNSSVRAIKVKKNSISNLKHSVFAQSPKNKSLPPACLSYADFLKTLSPDNLSTLEELQSLIISVVLLSLKTFESPNYQVNMKVTESICDFLVILKLPELFLSHKDDIIRILLLNVVRHLRLPDWFNIESDDDCETSFLNYRSTSLERVIKNIVHVSPNLLSYYTHSYIFNQLNQFKAVCTSISGVSFGSYSTYLTQPYQYSPLLTHPQLVEKTGFNTISTMAVSSSAHSTFMQRLMALTEIDSSLVTSSSVPVSAVSTLSSKANILDLELCIKLVHYIYECLPYFHVHCFISSWSPLLASLFASPLSSIHHPAVMEGWYQLVNRSAKTFTLFPVLLPDVLLSFLDHRGLNGDSPYIRQKACLYVSRTIKNIDISVKQHMANFIQQMLTCVMPVIDATLNKTTVASSQQLPQVSTQEALDLCEAVGVVCNKSILPSELYVSITTEVFTHLSKPLVNISNDKRAWYTQNPVLFNKRVCHIITSCSSVLQELTLDDVQSVATISFNSTTLPDILAYVLNLVIQAYVCCNTDTVPVPVDDDGVSSLDTVRTKTIVFLHNILEVLREHCVHMLLPALNPLLSTSTNLNIPQCIQLISQIISKFKVKLVEPMTSFVWVVIDKLTSCISSYDNAMLDSTALTAAAAIKPVSRFSVGVSVTNINPNNRLSTNTDNSGINLSAALSEQRQERDGIRRVFITFIKDICLHGLFNIFNCPDKQQTMFDTIQLISSFLLYTPDLTLVKNSLQVLKLIVQNAHHVDLTNANIPNSHVDQVLNLNSHSPVLPSNISVTTVDGVMSSSMLPANILHPFIYNVIITNLFKGLTTHTINVKDAAFYSILRELTPLVRIVTIINDKAKTTIADLIFNLYQHQHAIYLTQPQLQQKPALSVEEVREKIHLLLGLIEGNRNIDNDKISALFRDIILSLRLVHGFTY